MSSFFRTPSTRFPRSQVYPNLLSRTRCSQTQPLLSLGYDVGLTSNLLSGFTANQISMFNRQVVSRMTETGFTLWPAWELINPCTTQGIIADPSFYPNRSFYVVTEPRLGLTRGYVLPFCYFLSSCYVSMVVVWRRPFELSGRLIAGTTAVSDGPARSGYMRFF